MSAAPIAPARAAVRLEVAGEAATADAPPRMHDGVTDLSRDPGRPAAEDTVQHDAAPDACAHPDPEQLAGPPGRTHPVLREHADVHVVVESHVDPAEGLGDLRAQLDLGVE